MRRLVIAPHMDDESMGCGGLLAKFPEECTVAVLADGDATRRREFARAMEVLGVTAVRELRLPDGTVGADMPGLVRLLDGLCDELEPEELYLPFPSLHQDHIAAYEAGMRSARLSMSPGHWAAPSVFVYDVALYPTDLRWNTFEPLTAEQADRKARACLCYESETPGENHPITAIKDLAAGLGRVRGVAYAEQYALVRHVRP
ncbi:PIG-L deacetylase family protein [Kocuria sp.]|uniref:PIG-L deacetylase family protein n=1 Tax=Kocuria sp. TaxID=1871328 RepID=UPI0026DA7B0E|nr:PIG-L family deacetylase [Kocuria sp.]MDO4918419.1 PIG-L family deacetylase [Kocuria sp.]